MTATEPCLLSVLQARQVNDEDSLKGQLGSGTSFRHCEPLAIFAAQRPSGAGSARLQQVGHPDREDLNENMKLLF